VPEAKKVLRSLAAAGAKLKAEPETFNLRMGALSGTVVAIDMTVEKERDSRVISVHGEVAKVDGRAIHKSTLTVIWNNIEEVGGPAKARDILVEIAERNRIRQEFGASESLDHLYESRD
jgi:hypothetical protein